MTVAVSNCKPQELLLRTDNGQIEKTEREGEYIYYPTKIGKSTIYIERNSKGKKTLVGRREYRVKRANVVATFGGLHGAAKKLDVYTTRHLSGYMPDMDIDMPIRARSYDVTVVRNCIPVFKQTIKHPIGELDNATVDFFAKLKNDDRILFSTIKTTDCNGEWQIDPIEITVTHAEEFQPKDGAVYTISYGDTTKWEVR